MSRFLFVVPPPSERSRPVAAIARELTWRGHQVAWTGTRDLLAAATTSPGAPTPPIAGACLRSPTGLLLLWNDHLLPLARDMLPAVRAAVEGFRPDALVVQDQAIAGAVAGHLSGVRWATIVPSTGGLADPFWDLPGIDRKVRSRVRRFLREAGLDSWTATTIDPQRSADLVVAFSTEALAGPVADPTGRYVFVGPHPSPCHDMAFDWARIDPDRPLVLVAAETPSRSSAALLLKCAVDAVAALGVQGVIVGPPELARNPPPGVVVVPQAPLWALVRRSAVVVCDAAPALTCDALAHGVPLVVAPKAADQPLVAEQVVRAGAAVAVSPRPHDSGQLEQAIHTALTDPHIRSNARRIGDSFTAAGGVPTAADRLEAFATAPPELSPPARRRHQA